MAAAAAQPNYNTAISITVSAMVIALTLVIIYFLVKKPNPKPATGAATGSNSSNTSGGLFSLIDAAASGTTTTQQAATDTAVGSVLSTTGGGILGSLWDMVTGGGVTPDSTTTNPAQPASLDGINSTLNIIGQPAITPTTTPMGTVVLTYTSADNALLAALGVYPMSGVNLTNSYQWTNPVDGSLHTGSEQDIYNMATAQ